MNYNANEIMICQASRQLQDRDVVFVGIGLPNMACNLACKMHAPNLVLLYEAGAAGATPDRLPVSVKVASELTTTDEPNGRELQIIREELDRKHVFI